MTKYRQILEHVQTLAKEGDRLLSRVGKKKMSNSVGFAREYHHWYETAASFLGEISPDAKADFVRFYEGVSRSTMRDDPPIVLVLRDLGNTAMRSSLERKLSSQIGIIQAIPAMLDVRAFSLRQILSADLFTDELSTSRELLKTGHARAAGAVAAVVLERHLKLMCERHGIALGERETVGSLNAKLQEKYADPTEYRRVLWLNELRAQCDHVKEVEPTVGKVEEFIEAVAKFVSTVS